MKDKESKIIDYSFLKSNITFFLTGNLKYYEFKNAQNLALFL
jgi:hypothetical protein